MKSVILRVGTHYLVGLLLLFSIYMLLRGHNEPGGGFIGGLIGATGFVLYAIGCGTADARAARLVQPDTGQMGDLGDGGLVECHGTALRCWFENALRR